MKAAGKGIPSCWYALDKISLVDKSRCHFVKHRAENYNSGTYKTILDTGFFRDFLLGPHRTAYSL